MNSSNAKIIQVVDASTTDKAPPVSCSILIVSDTCAQATPEERRTLDKTGPALSHLIKQSSSDLTVMSVSYAPDTVTSIQDFIQKCVKSHIHLVVLSGGTGFAQRDVTPEALEPLLERRAPGLVHAMYAASLAITPFAVVARLVAGTIGETVLLTVPGSPKGAVENLGAVLKLLPHVCRLNAGTVASRVVHQHGTGPLEAQAGFPSQSSRQVNQAPSFVKMVDHHTCGGHHAHRHGKQTPESNDPSLPVSQRQRASPWPMVDVYAALALIRQQADAYTLKASEIPMDVRDVNLVGRIVSEDIYAKESVPAFSASIVDGYAFKAGLQKGSYPVANAVLAGDVSEGVLPAGTVARITTGAPLPQGADCVIMVEDTLLEHEQDGQEVRVQLCAELSAGENVRLPGSDVQAGSLLLAKGTPLSNTGGEQGLLISGGVFKVPVYVRPKITVLSTGDELAEGDVPLAMGHVRDSNRVALIAALHAAGFPATDGGIITDTAEALQQSLGQLVAEENVDVVLTTGGVSMGERDLLKSTLERSLQGTIHFGRIAMKPGKPSTFATVPRKTQPPMLFFALPGNPASALVTCQLLVLPALKQLAGFAPAACHLPKVAITLDGPVTLDPRPEYHRVVVSVTAAGTLRATSTGGQRSSRVGSLVCNGLLCLPAATEGKNSLEAGDQVQAMLCGPLVTD